MGSSFMIAQPDCGGQAKSLPNTWERRRTAVFIVLRTPPSPTRQTLPLAPASPLDSPATGSKPLPGSAKLLGEALRERMTVPAEMGRGARALFRAPRKAVSQVVEGLAESDGVALPSETPLKPGDRVKAALNEQ